MDPRHIYVIEFTDGVLKVGQTKNAAQRLSSHRSSAKMRGCDVHRSWFSPPHTGFLDNESSLIDFCRSQWEQEFGREYFTGGDFSLVVKHAEQLRFRIRERNPAAEEEAKRKLAVLKNRDALIREAFAEKFTKKEIHQRSGVARTTIDRILKENRIVPITKITARSNGDWETCTTAWVQVARESGHDAEVVKGEQANNNSPVVLVDGAHYVLSRYSDNGTVVHVDYKARKYNGTWTPAP